MIVRRCQSDGDGDPFNDDKELRFRFNQITFESYLASLLKDTNESREGTRLMRWIANDKEFATDGGTESAW
jgi:hypothetical protein